MELAHALLTRLVVETPSEQLAARLAIDVVSGLPDDGFVLSSEAIWLWISCNSEPGDWLPATAPPRRSWRDRVRNLVHRATDGFVLSSEAIWLWTSCISEPEDWLPSLAPPRGSWRDRLRNLVREASS
jgi:hypothetical protein